MKRSCISVLQNSSETGRKSRSCLGGAGTSGREEDIRKGLEGRIVYIHVNGKLTPAEAVPGMGGEGIKENGGGG
jgi:hypothetical protein